MLRFKTIFLLLSTSLIICAGPANCDAKHRADRHGFYFEYGLGFNTIKGFNAAASFNYILNEHFELLTGFQYAVRKASEIPSDYDSNPIIDLGLGLTYPTDQFTGGTIGEAYRTYPIQGKSAMVLYKAELLLGNTESATNFEKYRGTLKNHENYNYIYEKGFDAGAKVSMGLYLSPSKIVGFHITAFGILTTRFSTFGINVGMQIGRLKRYK